MDTKSGLYTPFYLTWTRGIVSMDTTPVVCPSPSSHAGSNKILTCAAIVVPARVIIVRRAPD